jgi:membrane protein
MAVKFQTRSAKVKSSIWTLAVYALLALVAVVRQALFRPRSPDPLAENRPQPDFASPVSGREDAASNPLEPLTRPRAWWSLLRDSVSGWINHKAAKLGAALAYYSVFSLGPLMVVVIAIAGLIFGEGAVRGELSAQLGNLLGEQGAKGVESMLAGAGRPREGVFATVLGVATLLFAAVGVVVQLKDALNTVWEAEVPKRSGIWGFVRTYAVSLAGVLSLGFLLLVSLVITTALSAMGSMLAPYLPEFVFHLVSFLISFAVITLLFAMMFKWLPDVEVTWRDVAPGAIATAALFEIGKLLIGLYIGKQGLESTYGAAASIVVVLIWVYYSAQLVLFGAEFTRVYTQKYGSRREETSAVSGESLPSGNDPRGESLRRKKLRQLNA